MVAFLDTPDGRAIAYVKTPGTGPGIVFLGGFMSDMEGTKALDLEVRAQAAGRAFLRLDYSGHGHSSGAFEDGSIGAWAADAGAALAALTDGPQIVVGSSMGGWIGLLLARSMADRFAGFVGIAAAPDFTEDSMWDGFDADQRTALSRDGRVVLPSDYSDDGYIITRNLIEDGRRNLVLRAPLDIPVPVRLLHGTADTDVALSVPLRLLDHLTCPDARLTLVKDADHRFSDPPQLDLIWQAICDIT